jgi:hypothetical protein
MPKRKKPAPRSKKPIDTFPRKRLRGRPGVRASELAGRSYNYHVIFHQIWDLVGERLLKASTEDDIVAAFQGTPHHDEFKGISALLLKAARDPHFPNDRGARINFLADSLAARGMVSLRRSRDICGRERAREKREQKHHIIRHEYYVECSCSYKGPARDNACPECGAKIPPSFGGVSWGT